MAACVAVSLAFNLLRFGVAVLLLSVAVTDTRVPGLKWDALEVWEASALPGAWHYRALVFGRLQNDGTRSFYFETTSKPGEIFIALHLGSYQGVFYYKKTRPCLFCSCPVTCEVAISASTFLGNCFLSQEMMCALRNCCQVQPR